MSTKPTSVDEYINGFPPEMARRLRRLRTVINKAAPGLTESISYGIPTFKLNGRPVIHFGGWAHHIGLYPVPQLSPDLEKRVAPLRSTKATVQLPNDKSLPVHLISDIVREVAAQRGG